MQRLNISLHVRNVNQKLSEGFWSLISFWTLVLKSHLEFESSLQWATLLAKAFFASQLHWEILGYIFSGKINPLILSYKVSLKSFLQIRFFIFFSKEFSLYHLSKVAHIFSWLYFQFLFIHVFVNLCIGVHMSIKYKSILWKLQKLRRFICNHLTVDGLNPYDRILLSPSSL